jgi:flagellar biosynthetic protein FliR
VDLPAASAFGFALVLLRTAGLLLTAPLLANRQVPARIRMALALAVSFAVFAGAGAPAVAPPPSLLGLAFLSAVETATGALAGLAARFALDAALAAGHLAGNAAGLGFGHMIDPTSGQESNPVSEVLLVLAQAAALALGLHREAIAWLARSVRAFPPGGARDLSQLASQVVGEAVVAIALAVRIAFPILAAVLVGHAALGLMNRMAPQLGLGNVGFSVAILAGGIGLWLVAPSAAELCARAALQAFGG